MTKKNTTKTAQKKNNQHQQQQQSELQMQFQQQASKDQLSEQQSNNLQENSQSNQQLEQQPEIQKQIQEQDDEHSNNPQKYKAIQSNKGVCYISRIPPYMKPNQIKKILTQTGYEIQRVYLLEETDWIKKNRVRKGGNKKTCYTQGWIQFNDKRMAKLAALTLNGQKMVPKKHNFYSQDLWNLKYLPKFKWHHLTERLAHQQRLKKQRLKVQLQQQKKIQQFYQSKIQKSKFIQKIISKKLKKGKQINSNLKDKRRTFQQVSLVQQEKDQ